MSDDSKFALSLTAAISIFAFGITAVSIGAAYAEYGVIIAGFVACIVSVLFLRKLFRRIPTENPEAD